MISEVAKSSLSPAVRRLQGERVHLPKESQVVLAGQPLLVSQERAQWVPRQNAREPNFCTQMSLVSHMEVHCPLKNELSQ